MPFGLPTASGAIIDAKRALEAIISQKLDCNNPESVLDDVIKSDRTIQFIITGYTAGGLSWSALRKVETIKSQIKDAIRSVKDNPQFLAKCSSKSKNQTVVEELAIMILDAIFTSGKVNIIKNNAKMATRYNRIKRAKFNMKEVDRLKKEEEGAKGGGTRKQSRKARRKTQRRRR